MLEKSFLFNIKKSKKEFGPFINSRPSVYHFFEIRDINFIQRKDDELIKFKNVEQGGS